MDGDMQTLANYFTQIAIGSPQQVKEAETFLRGIETSPNFSLKLLEFLRLSVPEHTLLSAAIFFKNLLRDKWPPVLDHSLSLPFSFMQPFHLIDSYLLEYRRRTNSSSPTARNRSSNNICSI